MPHWRRRAAAAMLALASVVAPRVALSQHDAHAGGHGKPALGTVDFPNTGARAAQEPFLLGVALLHSFEYDDAAVAFRTAQKADPTFALAYWCEALTYNHVLWGQEDVPAARAALARLAPTMRARLAKAGNARERAFGAAVEQLFTDAPAADRERAFGDSMVAYASAAPNDLEATAFAALGAMVAGRDELAVTLAERVYAARPNHPGGAHYLIHATDSPLLADRGLAAARAYDKIAPDAEHALHMPSHIYLQVGMWKDVVASNERAWPASRAWVAKNKVSAGESSWHSLQWLQYGYLQQGRLAAARALIDSARTILRGIRTGTEAYPDAHYTVETLTFQYASESGDWSLWPAGWPSAVDRLREAASARSMRARQFATNAAYHAAAAAVARGDTVSARTGATQMRADAAALPAGSPRRAGLERLAIQVEGLIAARGGDTTHAIVLFQRAAEIERSASGSAPLGPITTTPSSELLGNALLSAGRATDAVAAYKTATEQRRGRSAALLGLARAKRAAGDRTGARDAYVRVAANWERADAAMPGLSEVRTAAR